MRPREFSNATDEAASGRQGLRNRGLVPPPQRRVEKGNWRHFTPVLPGSGPGGGAIDWNALHEHRPKRVPLPGYPFERQRYCPDQPLPAGTLRDGEGWLYFPETAADSTTSSPGTQTPAPVPSLGLACPRTPLSCQARFDHLLADIRNLLHRTSGIDLGSADPAAEFLDLGFDSLFLTQASLALKKHFGIKITFRQLMEQQTSVKTPWRNGWM